MAEKVILPEAELQKYHERISELEAADRSDKPEKSGRQVSKLLREAGEPELRRLFVLLAAGEVPEHLPTKKKAKAAVSALTPYFECRENVLLAVSLLEESGLRKASGWTDAPDEEIGLLRAVVEKDAALGRTPLMMELPFDDAFRLWMALGSWRAVLVRAGLRPLSGERLDSARTDYALRTASPENLGKELPPDMRSDLQRICDLARILGRTPAKGEVPESVFRRVNKAFGSYRAAIGFMGLTPLSKQEDRRISAETAKRNRRQSGE